jgi:hypothetical protein
MISSRKRFITVLLLLVSAALAFAADKYVPLGGNSLANELQWLAIQTACVGQYNMAQTGDYSIGDPRDYYTPADIREYLARQSGSRTATATVYGIYLITPRPTATRWCTAVGLRKRRHDLLDRSLLDRQHRLCVVENSREVQRNSAQQLSAVRLTTTNDVLALFNSGDANLKQKRYDQAIADCNAALRLNPNIALA